MMAPNLYDDGRMIAAYTRLEKMPLETARSIKAAARASGISVAEMLDAMDQVVNAYGAEDAMYGVGARLRGLCASVVGSVRPPWLSRWHYLRTSTGYQARVGFSFWHRNENDFTCRNLPWLWRLWGGVSLRIGDKRYSIIYDNPKVF